jgi:hypothetical protein
MRTRFISLAWSSMVCSSVGGSLKPIGTMTSLWMKFKTSSATPGRVAFTAMVTVVRRIPFSSVVLPR